MTPRSGIKDELQFSVAPNIIEDLGVNLYTTLPKALVEFVANAYDADAKWVNITIDEDKIVEQSEILTAQLRAWRKQNPDRADDVPTEMQVLPADVTIVIEDCGDGMRRDDLESKFLVIGRRRRSTNNIDRASSGGRAVMGRKGIGKLAGFGVAHEMVVESMFKQESHATRIALNLDELRKVTDTRLVSVPAERVADGAGLDPNGTRITLRRLVFHAMQARRRQKAKNEKADPNETPSLLSDIIDALHEHFYAIKREDFEIRVNGTCIPDAKVEFERSYPEPELGIDQLVTYVYQPDGSESVFPVHYRIRFRAKGKPLPAKQRGIRLYAHRRLAAGASLLDVSTAIHGFGFSAYMDAIAVADFIDERNSDYIATDRNEVRWDSLLLHKLKLYLTERMVDALYEFAEFKTEQKNKEVDQDEFTQKTIADAGLPAHRRDTAEKMARIIARADDDGVRGTFYKSTLTSIVSALGTGDILNALNKIAASGNPNLAELMVEITRLTRQEFDEFIGVVTARIKVIQTLEAMCDAASFKDKKNEAQLHELLENSPWLIDPTFFEFLASDQTEGSVKRELAKHLEIGTDVPKDYDSTTSKEADPLEENLRPDLVFLLGNETLKRVVVVELKALNTPLHIDHIIQLTGYMDTVSTYLKRKYPNETYKVDGLLIGSIDTVSNAKKIKSLRTHMGMHMVQNCPWQVHDIRDLLKRTRRAHRELLNAYDRAKAAHKSNASAS